MPTYFRFFNFYKGSLKTTFCKTENFNLFRLPMPQRIMCKPKVPQCVVLVGDKMVKKIAIKMLEWIKRSEWITCEIKNDY